MRGGRLWEGDNGEGWTGDLRRMRLLRVWTEGGGRKG